MTVLDPSVEALISMLTQVAEDPTRFPPSSISHIASQAARIIRGEWPVSMGPPPTPIHAQLSLYAVLEGAGS